MKTGYLLLLGLMLAGCSSISQTEHNAANAPALAAGGQRTSPYHAKVVSEFSDGETKFLDMMPGSNP